MTLEIVKIQHIKYKIEHYTGTLDFPCDFCNTHSYDNYHFRIDNSILMVVCKDCLMRVIK